MPGAGIRIPASAVGSAEITDGSVALADMANLAADRVIGRATGAGTGVPTALTAAQVLTILGLSTPGTGGNAVLDDASTDAVLTTLGFPAAGFMHKGSRCLYPDVIGGGTIQTTATTAYFVYLGQTARAFTPKYVAFLLTAVSTTDSVGEVGFFTTPLAGGCKAGQTVTPIASAFKTALDDLTAGAVKRAGNAVAMAVSVAAGVHLWAGIRTNATGNEPTVRGILDNGTGNVLTTGSAAAFDGTTAYTGAIPTAASTAVCPYLWAEFD